MTIESSNIKHKIANGYYNRTYWPEKYTNRVDGIFKGIAVSAVFSIPPADSEGCRDFRMIELFNKVYVVPDDQCVQDVVKDATKSAKSAITLRPQKFKNLRCFNNNRNLILNQDLFVLKFFPDEESRKAQLEEDKRFYSQNPPVLTLTEQNCILL